MVPPGSPSLPPTPRADPRTPPPWASEDEIARQMAHDLHSNYHYDMPTAVWQYILGRSMKYSCGLWDAEHRTLEEAQEANLAQVVASLYLTANSHVLDVGAGWGAFAVYAAQHSGCRVTGIGLAPHAVEYAQAWAGRAGLGGRVEVRVTPALALPEPPGTFSHVVFLETFEHMRLKRETVASCCRGLQAGGTLFMQVIGVKSPSYREQALTTAGTDHIYRNYGQVGDPVPLSATLAALEENNLEIMQVGSITTHYPQTLRAWAENTRRHGREIDALTSPGRAEELRTYFMLGWLGYSQGLGVNHQVWARLRPQSRKGAHDG